MTERRIGIRDIPKATVGKISGEVLMNAIGIEVVDLDNNLTIVKKHLETDSMILLFNHAKNDFFVWARFIENNLNSLSNAKALVAMKYLDPKRGKGSKAFSLFFPTWKAAFGIDASPIVQRKDHELYPDHKKINTSSVINARKFLQIPGHVLAFSPEGTRSLTGEIGEAEEGTELILKLKQGAIILPVAAEFPIGSDLKLYRNKTALKIHVGKPYSYEEIKAESEQTGKNIPELAMRRIANLLPEQNHGFYR